MTQKKNPDNKNKGKDKKDPKKKGRKKGQTKKKDAIVYYPTVINKPGEESKIEMSEHEIAYNDLLFSVKLEALAKKGLTNDQIIKELPIARETFYKKLKSDQYFTYVLFKHRHIAKNMVENAMFKSAVGFTYKEDHVTPLGMIVEATKYCTPQVSAQKEWLHNRYPDEWKKKIEYQGSLGADVSQISVTIRRREE